MESHKGYIIIKENEYFFTLDDFLFIIYVGANPSARISWPEINTIIDNEWIHVFDADNNELYLKVDCAEYHHKDEYCYHILGFIQLFHFNRNPLNVNVKKEKTVFECKSIIIRNPIIDFMLRKDKTVIDRSIHLLNMWKDEKAILDDVPSRKSFQIKIDEIAYMLCFEMMSRFEYPKPFPFEMFNTLSVRSEVGVSIDNIWNVIMAIKLFLQLISQSRIVNFDDIMIDFKEEAHPDYNAFIYMRQDKEQNIEKDKVFCYEHIEQGIESIFKQILDNQICFRSLFRYSDKEISTYDIMNICAAFESQFSAANPKFIDKGQKAIKRRMVKDLEGLRGNYTSDEHEHFDTVLDGLKHYNDTLKKRLEIALEEFVRIYGEKEVEFGFANDFSLLPERMKNTRNALDHGNPNYYLTTAMFRDAELLRAITYMLILQAAKIDDINIKECLIKLSRYPL